MGGGVSLCPSLIYALLLQNVMKSQVLRNDVEATYIAVETATFYGVKQNPSRVLVNSQEAVFSYRDNQVRTDEPPQPFQVFDVVFCCFRLLPAGVDRR